MHFRVEGLNDHLRSKGSKKVCSVLGLFHLGDCDPRDREQEIEWGCKAVMEERSKAGRPLSTTGVKPWGRRPPGGQVAIGLPPTQTRLGLDPHWFLLGDTPFLRNVYDEVSQRQWGSEHQKINCEAENGHNLTKLTTHYLYLYPHQLQVGSVSKRIDW